MLLQLLAIYDSTGNDLSSNPELDQTLLYHALLRRFAERELEKGRTGGFRALPAAEQETAIDQELERLGVAAIGMFNRQATYIRSDQLNADLAFFGAERLVDAAALPRRAS